jgi:lipopolysaccharide exporter
MAWGLLGSVARLVLQFGGQVTIARLLGPAHMGTFATAYLVITLSNFVADWGFAYGLIRLPKVGQAQIQSALGLQLLTGGLTTLALALGAPWLEALLGIPGITPIVQALSPVILIQSASAVSLNLLKRELDYRHIQVVQVGGYLAGYLLFGIPVAWYWRSPWALVGAALIQALVSGLLLYGGARHTLRPRLTLRAEDGLGRFGATVVVTNLVNWVSTSLDRLLVANLFGSHSAGLYSVATTLLNTPASTLVSVTQPVFYAAYCRATPAAGRFEGPYLLSLEMAGFFVLTAAAAFYFAVPELIALLYGAEWLDAVAVLQPMTVSMALYVLCSLAIPVIWAGRRELLEVKIQSVALVAWLPLALFSVQHSVAFLAWTVAAAQALRLVLLNVVLCRAFSFRAAAAARALLPGVFVAGVVALLCFAAEAVLEAHPASGAAAAFLSRAAACSVAWVLAIGLWVYFVDRRPLHFTRQAIAGRLDGLLDGRIEGG